MRKINFFAVLAFLMLLSSCQKQDETIKIGAILPLTGIQAGLGTSMKAGLELAIEELNNGDSPIKYELLVEDVASEQRNVLNAYNKLKTMNGVSIFVTPGSAYSLALKPVIIKDDKLLICVASHPDITSGGEYNIFKIGNDAVDESMAIIEKLNNSVDKKTVLYYPNTEYGIPFYDTLIKNDDAIISSKYDETNVDYKNIVVQGLNNKPNNIVAIGFSSALGVLVKTLKDMGYNGPILSNTGFASSDVLTAAGESAKGVEYIDYKIGDSESTKKRNEIIRSRYNIDFSSICFLAYSIPYYINDTQKVLDLNSKHISDQIRSKDSLVISSEYIYYVSKNGDIKPSLTLKQYK